ncbi:homeobox protein Hox-B4-like [Eurytemora carolleeae]|uniref:homeobox protein Hox-B4-like n=1 Tax=Eurytemora carolleeae TaxID=1294199 RepID=UPI000C78FBA7|nr:homeobox protein Hox-B4-like [Eurytemora carolleeae]|eukprot:XP_023348943.1 homeobox protein Hox-B4-like [Eurytemora affinis]
MPVPTDNGNDINHPVVPPPTPPPDPPPTPPPPVENLPVEPPLAGVNGIIPHLAQNVIVNNNNNRVDQPPQPVNPSQNATETERQNLDLEEDIFQSPLSELRAASNILIREANTSPRRRRLLPGPTLLPLARHRVNLRPYIPRREWLHLAHYCGFNVESPSSQSKARGTFAS